MRIFVGVPWIEAPKTAWLSTMAIFGTFAGCIRQYYYVSIRSPSSACHWSHNAPGCCHVEEWQTVLRGGPIKSETSLCVQTTVQWLWYRVWWIFVSRLLSVCAYAVQVQLLQVSSVTRCHVTVCLATQLTRRLACSQTAYVSCFVRLSIIVYFQFIVLNWPDEEEQ